MVGRNYFCEIKKLCTLKKLLPEIKYSNLEKEILETLEKDMKYVQS